MEKMTNDKKFIGRKVTIDRGTKFEKTNNFTFLKKFYDEKSNTSTIFEVQDFRAIDTIEIKYADFSSLLISKKLDLNNIEHLKFIPKDVLVKTNHFMICTALQTIIHTRKAEGKPNKIDLIEKDFDKFTQRDFQSLGLGKLRFFFTLKCKEFSISSSDEVSVVLENGSSSCDTAAKNLYFQSFQKAPAPKKHSKKQALEVLIID